MHLWTKILGPSCRCMCEPAEPCICPHQWGHKMLSKPEPHTNEIFLSSGRRWGLQAKPATWGKRRGSLSPLWLTEVPHLSLRIQPQFFWKEQDTLESDDKQHWRPRGHASLREVSSSKSLSLPPGPMACPTASGDRAFSHHLLFLLSALGSPRLILIKDLGSL